MSRPEPTATLSAESRQSLSFKSPPAPSSPAARHDSGHESEESNVSRVAHTLTACRRCRSRKTKCDPGLPKCGPCAKSGDHCEYFDIARGKMIPRTYVIHLQDTVKSLEAELARLEGPNQSQNRSVSDAEAMVREAGRVRFDEGIEPRFLGSSSGIAMTRLVMELAKSYTGTSSIRNIVPEAAPRKASQPSSEPEGQKKAYPILSSVAAEGLPRREITDKLVEVYCQRSQFLLPTLHEPTFREDVEAVYAGSSDAYQNFVLKMVLAISIQKLNNQWAGLADAYYLAAFAHLEAVVRPMDLKTLQCFILIGQYSLLTPTRTAVYYVVGLATKLCQQLGLHEEQTIVHGADGRELNALEQDMRRRLFWIVTSMEYGLSHSLGRPSAMSIGPDHIDVQLFQQCDDIYISADGVQEGPLSPKKLIAIHFFKMRLLQAEIRRKLYQKKRDTPVDDQDPWFSAMEAKVDDWRSSSPYNAEGSGHSNAWFTSKYNTIIVLLFRPSPQIPNPSARAAIRCFEASAFNIRMQKAQMDESSVDFTWVLVQTLFMALNTVMWSLSYPEVRRRSTKTEMEYLLNIVLHSIKQCEERWPGAGEAYILYQQLVSASLKVYDNDNMAALASPPLTEGSPASHYLESRHSSASSPAAHRGSYPDSSTQSATNVSPLVYPVRGHQSDEIPPPAQLNHAFPSPEYLNTFHSVPIETEAPFNAMATGFEDQPIPWNPLFTSPPILPGILEGAAAPVAEPGPFELSTVADYSQFIYPQPTQYRPRHQTSLSPDEQEELMGRLETDGMENIGELLDQSANFFNSLGTP